MTLRTELKVAAFVPNLDSACGRVSSWLHTPCGYALRLKGSRRSPERGAETVRLVLVGAETECAWFLSVLKQNALGSCWC